jgi:hypothetical protein
MHITEPLPGEKRARLVFGLDWRAYPVKGARAERRRYAGDFGATHYVEYKVGSELIGGFAMPDVAGTGKSRLYSGAARVALHPQIRQRSAALVLLQDDQRVHLIFVVRGAVRSDEVLTLEAAHSRRAAIENECRRANLALVTLGSGPSISEVDESFTPAALLADRKCGRIGKLPMHIPTALPLVVIVVATVFGVVKLIGAFEPPPPPPKHAPTPAELYAQAVRQAFVRPSPRASELAPALIARLGNQETVLAGWLFEKAQCGSTGRCEITYRRVGGSFDGFSQVALASMRPLRFNPDGLHLVAQGPEIPTSATVLPNEAKTWPDEQALIDMLQTPPQRLSVKPYELDTHGYTVKLEQLKPLPSLVPVATHGATGKSLPMIRQGNWTIEGFRWQAPLLGRLPASMTLESLTVELWLKDQVGIHFTAKGKYYVLD